MLKPVAILHSLEDSPQWLDQQLVYAYIHAVYEVPELGLRLRIGAHSSVLDEWLEAKNELQFCIITAWNPGSKLRSRAENEVRNAALATALSLQAACVLTARNTSPEGAWLEESFFAAGLSQQAVVALAGHFEQNAVLAGKKGRQCALWWIKNNE